MDSLRIRTIINVLLVVNIVIEKTIERNDKRVNLRSKVEQILVLYLISHHHSGTDENNYSNEYSLAL